MPNKINIGQEIKKKKEQLGLKTTELANEANIDRRQAYRIYKRKSIDTDVLFDLSIQLKYDFFKLYSDELADRIA
jgi:transcriptional regulator with XRE-family HTH domain